MKVDLSINVFVMFDVKLLKPEGLNPKCHWTESHFPKCTWWQPISCIDIMYKLLLWKERQAQVTYYLKAWALYEIKYWGTKGWCFVDPAWLYLFHDFLLANYTLFPCRHGQKNKLLDFPFLTHQGVCKWILLSQLMLYHLLHWEYTPIMKQRPLIGRQEIGNVTTMKFLKIWVEFYTTESGRAQTDKLPPSL